MIWLPPSPLLLAIYKDLNLATERRKTKREGCGKPFVAVFSDGGGGGMGEGDVVAN
jgi:hypothetical protein